VWLLFLRGEDKKMKNDNSQKWKNDTFVQQQEAEAQRIVHVFGPNYVLTRVDGNPPTYQLTRQDQQQHLIVYWNVIEMLPEVVLITLLMNAWFDVPYETIVAELAAAGISFALSQDAYDRVKNVIMEARADGYERAEDDEYKHLALSGAVRMEVAQEQASEAVTEGFIRADEVWMYVLGWMRGYQDGLDQEQD
jgi:hypothetical protein